jgi:O-methyltransferase
MEAMQMADVLQESRVRTREEWDRADSTDSAVVLVGNPTLIKQTAIRFVQGIGGARAQSLLGTSAYAARLVREIGTYWAELRDLRPTLKRLRPLSQVGAYDFMYAARLVRFILANDIPGNFVECGVWRGGMSFLMADLVRQAGSNRSTWMFDSFEGMPEPDDRDGAAAVIAEGLDNNRVSLEQVQSIANQLGLAPYTRLVKGWFDDTLPARREEIGPIALLRIDADWHASVRCCLDNLYDQVVEGGFIVFDDYFDFPGCAIAVHEFLGERHLGHRLLTGHGIALLRKD